jgi:hypothetical protein
MYDVQDSHPIDAPAAPVRQAETAKDRRRPAAFTTLARLLFRFCAAQRWG